MLAMMADNIEHVVSYWLLFQKFRSPALAGFAEVSHWMPFLLFSVFFGGLADRYDCRKIIQAAQVLFMGVSATWAVLFFTNSIQVWHASVLLIIHGVAGVMWAPAEQLLIHDLVGAEDLQSAVRLNATARQLGILFGPAVGAGLMLLLSPALALVANVVIYLPLTLWLVYVPYSGHLRKEGAAKRTLAWQDIKDAIREGARNRPIITMVILGGSASLFIGNVVQTLMPAFANDLGAGEAGFAYSALLMAGRGGRRLWRIPPRGQGLASRECPKHDHLQHLLVRRHRHVCGVHQLLLVACPAVLRRHFEPCALFFGTSHCSD